MLLNERSVGQNIKSLILSEINEINTNKESRMFFIMSKFSKYETCNVLSNKLRNC